MNRNPFVLGFVAILLVVTAACGAAATSTSAPRQEPAATQEPTATPAPTASPVATATVAPTETPVPYALPPGAEDTPVPTATTAPVPTATSPAAATPVPTTTLATATAASAATSTPLPTATAVPTAAAPAGPSMIAIGPTKDNTLYEQPEGALSNGAGKHIFAGRNNGELIRRGVIAFDFAGNIPQDAVIISVALTLNVSRTQSASQDVQLHRLLIDWGEGVSEAGGHEGGGGPAKPGDATWLHSSFDSDLWQTAGGDYSAAASASQAVQATGKYTWGSTDGMVADVQAWLDDPSANFGWVIIGNETGRQTAKRFDSKDNPEEANRPSLIVEFTSASGS